MATNEISSEEAEERDYVTSAKNQVRSISKVKPFSKDVAGQFILNLVNV